MLSGRRGAALLEALVALTIVTISVSSALSVLIHAAQEQRTLDARERQLGGAGKLLVVYSLLTRDQLDQRLGQQVIDSWVLRVQRPEENLYRVAVAAGTSPEHELLVTVLYRPPSK
jgi:Tfp pilus assembly protein PilV